MAGRAWISSAARVASARSTTTGRALPAPVLHGVRMLSGFSLSHVQVHYNSGEPATMAAHGFARGNQIHLAPGAEAALPHEAWHLVQQAQNRVRANGLADNGDAINHDPALEQEADLMGGRVTRIAQGLEAPPARPSRAMSMTGPSAGADGGAAQLNPRSRFLQSLSRSWGGAPFSSLSSGGSNGSLRPRAPIPATPASSPPAAASAGALIPRVGGISFGPTMGVLRSQSNSYYRSVFNSPAVHRSIDTQGYLSGPERARRARLAQQARERQAALEARPPQAVPRHDPVPPPYAGAPTDQDLVHYSNGTGAGYVNAHWVGVNQDPRYTAGVAERTGHATAQPGYATRLDEVSLDGLPSHSVEEAFANTGATNRHPVLGERVVATRIPPASLRHTVTWPLPALVQGEDAAQAQPMGQPGQVHPNYLANLGRMLAEDGASPEQGVAFDVETTRHAHPDGVSPPIEIDAIVNQRPHPQWEHVVAEHEGRRPL